MSSGVPQVTACSFTVPPLLALTNSPTFTATAVQGSSQDPKPVDLLSELSDPATPATP